MSEETIKVKKINIGGVKYLYDPKTNIVYDIESQEPIGVLSKDKKEIYFYDDEEEEDDDDEDDEITRHLEQVAMDKKIRDIRKQGRKPVIPKPYPSDIQFTEKEQRFYDEDKNYIDDTARQLNNPKSGQVILIPDPMRREVSYKRASQMRWDKGIGRPYSYNEDLILTKMTDLKKLINDEKDETKKEQKKRMLQLLLPKLREAKEQDKVEGVAIKREQETMGQEEQQTRQYLEDVEEAKKQEKRRQQEIEDAKLKLTPNEVKQQLNTDPPPSWVTIRSRPFTAVRWLDYEKDKDDYGGSLKKVKDLKYFKPKRVYKVWKSEDLIDPDTLEPIGTLTPNPMPLKDNFVLTLNELGQQRLEEYKQIDTEEAEKDRQVELKEKEAERLKQERQKQREEERQKQREEPKKIEKVVEKDTEKEAIREAKREARRKEKEAEREKRQKEKEAEREKRREERKKAKEGTGIKSVIDNPELYEKAKEYADNIFKKPSAYKSGFIIKKYKELGGTYSGDKPKTTGIARWFKEEWKDIGNKEYPVYRPTKRVTIETPLTPDEIKPSNLKKQIKLKQEIKGDANLPPFEKKGTGKVIPVGIALDKISPYDEIWNYSNPKKVAEMAEKYLGKDDAKFVFRSSNPKKKYMVYDKTKEKWVFFGEMGYEDFTKHQDEKRRENYLKRTANMKGNWKDNEYSANNLSRNILW